MNTTTKRDDGGPAFPTDNEAQVGNNTWHFAGMTLRDYFAAKALAGIASTYHENWTPESAAKNAYELADAMLAERSMATGAAS